MAWDPRPAVCVVLAAAGYPGAYATGKPIAGLDALAAQADPDVFVFHAGTRLENGQTVTSGGRVLGVTALGSDLAEARARAYEAAERITFEGRYLAARHCGRAGRRLDTPPTCAPIFASSSRRLLAGCAGR